MARSVIARKKGDSFQAYFFWLQACKLLNPKSNVIKVEYELNTHEGFDDVAIHYNQSLLIAGKEIDAEYFQLKYHIGHKQGFRASSLIDPEFIGTENQTILGRLLTIYRNDADKFIRSKFNFISTWGIDYTDSIKDLLNENGFINFDKLITGGIRSKFGKIRNSYLSHLNITQDELVILLKSLNISASKYTFNYLQDELNNSLKNVGLKEVGSAERAGKYEELIDRLHEEGITEFTKEQVIEICEKDNLFISVKINKGFRSDYTINHEYSKNQIETQLKRSYFNLKYNPNQYISRSSIEEDISEWLALPLRISSSVFLILASAGCGKTNTLAYLSKVYSERYITFLFAGPLIKLGDNGLWGELTNSLRLDETITKNRESIKNYFGKLIDSKQRVIIIIDAINEFPEPVKLKNELLIFTEEASEIGLSIIISCRDYYWGLFEAAWWVSFLKNKTKEPNLNKVTLSNYTSSETIDAFKVYFKNYNVFASPKGNAIEQFRHPLLLRFFCETYEGQKVGELKDVRLKNLFDTYWDLKLSSIAERIISQGSLESVTELKKILTDGLKSIALLMLSNNKRVLDDIDVKKILKSETQSILVSPYGRIVDEHIIIEELEQYGYESKTMIAFVFEEFMEYSMARALLSKWITFTLDEICNEVRNLTEKYKDFSQVFGVMLYVAIMLKVQRQIALWPALINQGDRWKEVVIETFKRLPEDQIDDGVFQAIIELLQVKEESIQIQALELLKYGRLKRIPTKELTVAVGSLVTHRKLPISRRAVIALSSFPASFSIPFIEKAIAKKRSREDDIAVIIQNSSKVLAKLDTGESILLLCKIIGGFWRFYNEQEIVDILGASVEKLIPLLDIDDVLTRLGAIKLIGYSNSQKGLQILENKINNEEYNIREYNKDELPKWVKLSYRPWSPIAIEKYDEKKQIQESITRLKENFDILSIKTAWKKEIEKLKTGKVVYELPYPLDSIKSYYSDSELVIFIIKKGLELRSKKKWQLTKTYDGILIKSIHTRLKNGIMTKADAFELANLLGLSEIKEKGYEFGTGHRYTDYWKEYIYRAWGISPLVMGKFDGYWD